MGTKERRERERRQRREAIISATLQLLQEEGWTSISMDRIAERAELSKGAIYLYFKNKEHLLTEILWMRLDELFERIRSVVSSEGEFEELVERIVRTVIAFFTENVDLFRFLYHSLPAGASDIMEGLHQNALNYHRRMLKMATEFYERFVPEKSDLTPQQLHIAISGLLWGFLSAKFFGQYEGEVDPELICRIFLRGVTR